MFTLLAKVVEVIPTPDGEHVVIDPMGPLFMSAIFLFLLLLPIIIILLFFFYKKKLQHQQILAAIEKGHPIEALLAKPVNKEKGWLYNISAGVGLLLVAGCLILVYSPMGVYRSGHRPENFLIFIPIILIGMGITRLMRGIYQKKEANKLEAPETMSEPTPDIHQV